jgi:hypothetical protein
VTVSPLPVTFSGTRNYDGTTTAAATILAASNLVTGDTLTFAGSGALASKNAGSQAITSFAGLTLSNANYTLTGASGAVTVNPLTLTVTGVVANNKSYDATTAATLNTSSAILAGALTGDTVSLTGGTGTFQTQNTGTAIPVTATSLIKAGADAINYTVVLPTGLNANISPTALTVIANNTTVAVGSPIPTLSASLSGLMGADTASVVARLSLSTTANASSPVGIYPIVASGGTALNYTLNYVNGLMTITAPAPIVSLTNALTSSAQQAVFGTLIGENKKSIPSDPGKINDIFAAIDSSQKENLPLCR